jgi:hypothetical protein
MMPSKFVTPRYDRGGFAGLPQRVRELLTGPEKWERIVLFLIDGFGLRFLEKFQEAAFLKRMQRDGRIEALRAQFPSTTTAQITTIHTGLPVGEHGVFEWNYYEPSLQAIITPLLFSFAGTPERDTLKAAGVKPRRLFPFTTLYRELKKSGVSTTIYQHREYTPSTFSDVIFAGATAYGYRTLPEALVNLGEALTRQVSPAYFFLYYDRLDVISHIYGPESPQVGAEIESLLLALETIFMRQVAGRGKRTLFLLTADHGQVETDPATTVYLNREPRFAGIEKFLKADAQDRPLVPAGSCRDFFLYVKEGLVDEAQAFLAARLEGQAEVRKVSELVESGYFGPQVSPVFRARAGDLVLLPFAGESVWWYEKDKFEQRYYGHHGGLTRQEMEIPLISCDISS